MHEAVNVNSGLPWRPQNVGDARAMGYLHGELQTGCGTSPSEKSMWQSTKLKGVGDMKSTLRSDMEVQNLESILLVLILVLF